MKRIFLHIIYFDNQILIYFYPALQNLSKLSTESRIVLSHKLVTLTALDKRYTIR